VTAPDTATGAGKIGFGVDQPPVKVTIVVAAHNADRWLAETLESVLAQTEKDWRCHLVDDGSTDRTADVAAEFAARDARFQVIRQQNTGVSAARNRLLELTRDDGPYVAVLDADDTWLPDALEVMCGVLEADPEAVGVHSLAEYMDETSAPNRPGEHPFVQRRKSVVRGDRVAPARFGDGMGFAELVVGSGLYPPASMLFRRSAVEAAGRYDPEYRAQGDWEMYIRMSRFGRFAELDRQTAWYRLREANLTGDRSKVHLFQARLLRKTWEQSPPGSEERRVTEVAYRHRQRQFARQFAGQARSALVGRHPRLLATNGVLTAWYGAHSVARRPPVPVVRAIRALARIQSSRWAT